MSKTKDGGEDKRRFRMLRQSNPIEDNQTVRVTRAGHVIDVLALLKEPTALNRFRKLDKYSYVELATGEVFEYNLNENRAQNTAGLKRTFKAIRHLINNNFTGAANELFITLTYAENMRDTERLLKDNEKFIKKLRYKYGNLDYLSIVEPQGRGAWHVHSLIKFYDVPSIYADNNKVIAPMWGHGFTTTRHIENVDNIGAYVSAYLCDIEICQANSEELLDAWAQNNAQFEQIEVADGDFRWLKMSNGVGAKLDVVERDVEVDGKTVHKKFLKGGRLHLYPSGMNLYRCSRGIKKPTTEKMSYSELKNIVGSRKADYTRTVEIELNDSLLNSITYEQYNTKRQEKQEEICGSGVSEAPTEQITVVSDIEERPRTARREYERARARRIAPTVAPLPLLDNKGCRPHVLLE